VNAIAPTVFRLTADPRGCSKTMNTPIKPVPDFWPGFLGRLGDPRTWRVPLFLCSRASDFIPATLFTPTALYRRLTPCPPKFRTAFSAAA